jgi:serine/tyrosine/threonine adenylyltransferase
MTLGPEFADEVNAASFPESILRFRNDRAAATIGLGALTDEEWIAHFARFEPLADNQPRPLATRYHGHQFRVYNPDLGDGRGFLFAQMREVGTGRLLDLGTKGSGRTPYSRTADGRLTLKGGVREALASEMLEALGVPTCRTFSLVETGERLKRPDEPSPTRSSVLVRLSYSNVRFGTFQRHAFHGRADLIQALIDHVVEVYYPELAVHEGAARAAPMLAAVVQRSAELCARWMAAGFVHGVLNSDNMNVTGESFDYGPYRFLPRNDPNFTAAYFDETGLYAFGRQPESVLWNLNQLAGALTLVVDKDPLIEALQGFGPAYRRALSSAMVRRLGLKPRSEEDDVGLAATAFKVLAEAGEALRWEPFFFDWFGGSESEDRAMGGPRAPLYSGAAAAELRGWFGAYETDRPERLDDPYFRRAEPEELLYDEIEAIWADIAERDDWLSFQSKLASIRAAGGAYAINSL